ncbi:uncharacterized protein J3R85_012696 [Psidium guajava]|nr:uncharacterized protein J3R85_012696 [Psidium guajava]
MPLQVWATSIQLAGSVQHEIWRFRRDFRGFEGSDKLLSPAVMEGGRRWSTVMRGWSTVEGRL